jgi:hypothetical protein
MSKDFTKELGDLGQSLGGIILMVTDQDKIQTAAELIKKYGQEFHSKIQTIDTPEEMSATYDNFINTVMSIVETLGIPEKQFKPTRKLVLNEMYRVKNTVFMPSVSKSK